MEQDQLPAKEPWLAVILSHIVLPGVGQFYARAWLAGTLFLLLFLGLLLGLAWSAFSVAGRLHHVLLFTAALLVVVVLNLFHAHRSARKRNPEAAEQARRDNKDPFLAVFLTNLLPGLGHLYLCRWLLGSLLILIWLMIWFGSRMLPDDALRQTAVLLVPVFVGAVCLLAFRAAPAQRRPAPQVRILVSLLIVASGMTPHLGAMLIGDHVVASYNVPTGAMSPTIQPGDVLLGRKLDYVPQRGDVVVFVPPDAPGDLYVMRLAALGGETIEIKDGGVFIDGRRLTDGVWGRFRFVNLGKPFETWVGEGRPYTVPPGHVFVLGDCSERSRDSRFFGALPASDLIGQAYKRYWPPDRQGPVK